MRISSPSAMVAGSPTRRLKQGAIVYFCDESSIVDERFMAVGGLAISQERLDEVTARIVELKAKANVTRELKWTNVKARAQNAHAAMVDLLAELVDRKQVHLHVRFAPFQLYDHKMSGPRRRSATVSKMHYQLLLHRALQFYGAHPIHIRPDDGDCTSQLVSYRDALTLEGQRKYDAHPSCVRSIEPRDSKREPMLQLLDVTLGAFTAVRNGRHERVHTATPKRLLADYALGAFGRPNLHGNTPKTERCLSIWNAVPMWEKGGGPQS
jgi:hypothetical protein